MIRIMVIEPTGIEAVLVDSGERGIADFLHETIGGWFDVVHDDSNHVVGYVHDEGLLIGLEHNPIASAFFGRFLVGTCVVVGALNEDGKYDGESHDVPTREISRAIRIMDAMKLWESNRKVETTHE